MCVSPNTKSSTKATAGAGLGPRDPGLKGVGGLVELADTQPHALSGELGYKGAAWTQWAFLPITTDQSEFCSVVSR